jgi:predicted nucleotidyltransferase
MDLEPIVWTYRASLGDRLIALAVYGSAVTGDLIPGFSDLDVFVVLDQPLSLERSIDLQRRMPELVGIAYLQPSYRVAAEPAPHLTPEAFRVLSGELPAGFVYDETSLRSAGSEALDSLAPIVRQDALDWTGAVGERRARHARLMTTQLKTAVRAHLVELGEPTLEVWRMPWHDLAQRWKRHDEPRAEQLEDLLTLLHAVGRDERASGEAALRLLDEVASLPR